MSFKIWGKDGTLNKSELQERLIQWGVSDAFSLISDIVRKGSGVVGQTRIFLLK